MVSAAAPETPTCRLPAISKVEPPPSIVTLSLPAVPDARMVAPPVCTWPPSLTLNVPVPALPTVNPEDICQLDPVPETETDPVEPDMSPITPAELTTMAAL